MNLTPTLTTRMTEQWLRYEAIEREVARFFSNTPFAKFPNSVLLKDARAWVSIHSNYAKLVRDLRQEIFGCAICAQPSCNHLRDEPL